MLRGTQTVAIIVLHSPTTNAFVMHRSYIRYTFVSKRVSLSLFDPELTLSFSNVFPFTCQQAEILNVHLRRRWNRILGPSASASQSLPEDALSRCRSFYFGFAPNQPLHNIKKRLSSIRLLVPQFVLEHLYKRR